MEKAPSRFPRNTAGAGKPSQPKAEQGGALHVRQVMKWTHISAAVTGRGRHVMNGVSAVTVRFLVLLVCVITLALLKCGLVVFFITVSPSFPMAANISCPSSPIPLVAHYPLLSPPRQDVLGGDS